MIFHYTLSDTKDNKNYNEIGLVYAPNMTEAINLLSEQYGNVSMRITKPDINDDHPILTLCSYETPIPK